MEQIRKEFDRIAVASEQERNPGGIYDPFLLPFVPRDCNRVLEVGCGTGEFTRQLARRVKHVTALDLSSEMIRVARQRSEDHQNIEYQVCDILQTDLPAEAFDSVVMIATLHHLPTVVLQDVKRALTVGGVLIIHDLLASSTVLDRAADPLKLVVHLLAHWSRTGRLRASRQVRKAWAEHGKNERYPTIRDVNAMSCCYLPGAYVKRHMLWRYTLVWRKRG
jgi:ubiquinone/menaquinone biosynthesis C-methylase UbiE